MNRLIRLWAVDSSFSTTLTAPALAVTFGSNTNGQLYQAQLGGENMPWKRYNDRILVSLIGRKS